MAHCTRDQKKGTILAHGGGSKSGGAGWAHGVGLKLVVLKEVCACCVIGVRLMLVLCKAVALIGILLLRLKIAALILLMVMGHKFGVSFSAIATRRNYCG